MPEQAGGQASGVLGWRAVLLDDHDCPIGLGPVPPPLHWLVSGRSVAPVLDRQELVEHVWSIIRSGFSDQDDPFFALAQRFYANRYDPEMALMVEWAPSISNMKILQGAGEPTSHPTLVIPTSTFSDEFDDDFDDGFPPEG